MPLGLVPATVSSYRFPPSGLAVNVRHSDGCPNSSVEFGNTLVERVSRLKFNLVSEFELVVNGVLIGSGCTGCRVLRDDTFGLFTRHHSPGSSLFFPSQTTDTQGTGSLLGEHLEHGRQDAPSASQAMTVGRFFSSPTPKRSSGVQRRSNPLAGRRLPSASPLRGLPSSERELYRGMKLDDSADSTFSPPAARPVGQVGKMFAGDTTVDPIESSPPDVTMALGDGKTTEKDGLGDSMHAGAPVDDVVTLVGTGSTDYGSMPPLPSTLAETVSRSRAPTMAPVGCARSGGSDMDEDEDGAQEVPLFDDFSEIASSDIPMAVGGGCNSEGTGLGDSRHASPEQVDSSDPIEGQLLIDQRGAYSHFIEVGHDVRYLGSVIVEMGNIIHRLERKVNALEDAADDAAREAAAVPVAVSPPVAPSGPRAPIPIGPAVSARKNKGRVPAVPRAPAVVPARPPPTAPAAVVRPSDVPAPPPTGPVASSSWSSVAKATGGEKSFTVVQRRKVASSSPSPSALTERERHIVVRFEKRGVKARLPAGVNSESVKNSLNAVLARGGGARFGSCVQHRTTGDLLLSLVQHSAVSVWGMVPRMEHALMELGINGFSFTQDRKRVKVLVSGLSLSPLGVGSLWKPEDWQGDGAFDDMIRDLEVTNPGFNVVGRPHWIGSLAGHKSHKHTTGSVVFVVELTDAVKACLDRRNVMVFSRRRPMRIWAELKATSVCTRCLRHGHVAVMCRAAIACKFCDGGHLSTQHKCSVRGCVAAMGSLCSHVNLACRLCSRIGHLTGDLSCPNLRAPTATASGRDSSPSSGKMVSEETTKLGITDRSAQKLVKSKEYLEVEKQFRDFPKFTEDPSPSKAIRSRCGSW